MVLGMGGHIPWSDAGGDIRMSDDIIRIDGVEYDKIDFADEGNGSIVVALRPKRKQTDCDACYWRRWIIGFGWDCVWAWRCKDDNHRVESHFLPGGPICPNGKVVE